MKISIITACYNNESTIKKCLDSVAQQEGDIEHILIDGLSTDKTVKIIKNYKHVAFFSSEKDEGIYDALNKGLNAATGDIIGFLHSDDVFYSNNTIAQIEQYFLDDDSLDAIYGDIEFVDDQGKILRFYSSRNFNKNDFSRGRMPAHTSFFAKRKVYEEFKFKLGYEIAADFDHLLRVFHSGKYNIDYKPITTTRMLTGGASTKNIQSRITINKEIARSCKENGVRTNMLKIYGKYLHKIFEFKV